MRVLSSVVDPRSGGPQRRSLHVANALADRGVTTDFLIPFGDDSFATAAREAGFGVHRVDLARLRPPTNVSGNVRFVRRFWSTVGEIQEILRTASIDVVHANMVVNFQTALATARSDTPLVWHFNDTLTPTPVKQAAALAARRWADEIVVAADAVHGYYFDQYVPSRTIYAPVDLGRFDPTRVDVDERALREELGLPPEATVVGTVGNINPVKGHKYLLWAIESLDDGRNVCVPIVGARLDSREAYFQRLELIRSNLGLEDRVRFVGFREDIPELLSLFDVFILPSIAEACPMVVLEAMAMECPVVATAVGGVPEQIPDDDHGWLVPPEDDTALSNAIDAVLSRPDEARRRAFNARRRVESVFSLEACVDDHEELYRLLSPGG